MPTSYGQFCPIALAAEVIAERWTPLILREIVLADARHFGEIQRGVGGISSSLLAERLRSLDAAGILERRRNPLGRGSEYHPTSAGTELGPLLTNIGIWAQRWIDVRREHCGPAYLMTRVTSLLETERFPLDTVTIRFDFGDGTPYWLILDRERPELCFHDPGREVRMVVTADPEAFANVLLGRMRMGDALERRLIEVDGPPELVRRFPNWIGLSPLAPYATRLAAVPERASTPDAATVAELAGAR